MSATSKPTPKPIIKKKQISQEPITKKPVQEEKEIKIDADDIETKEENTKPVPKIIKKKVVSIQAKDTAKDTDKTDKTDKVETEVSITSKDKQESTVKEKEKDKDSDEVLLDVSKNSKTSAISKKTSVKKQDVQNIINDEEIDYRQIMLHYDFTKNKTLPKITKYEKALLIGKRAKQIAEGATPNVKVLPGQNAIEIAEEELLQRKIPFIIKRPIGNKFEFWKPADMEVIMD